MRLFVILGKVYPTWIYIVSTCYMAEQSGASSKVYNSSMRQQVVRSHTLNSTLVLSPFKLDGSNYLAWSLACRMLFEANRLQHFIHGTTTMPQKLV